MRAITVYPIPTEDKLGAARDACAHFR